MRESVSAFSWRWQMKNGDLAILCNAIAKMRKKLSRNSPRRFARAVFLSTSKRQRNCTISSGVLPFVSKCCEKLEVDDDQEYRASYSARWSFARSTTCKSGCNFHGDPLRV